MMNPSQTNLTFTIHSATAEHAPKIRSLILRSGINPTALKWERFLVALTPEGDFIGCGQIKPHVDGVMELASLAVEPSWRGRGVGKALIQALIASHPEELHLMCTSNLGRLYERYGFRSLAPKEMPTYFRRVSKLGGVILNLARTGETMLVMRRPSSS